MVENTVCEAVLCILNNMITVLSWSAEMPIIALNVLVW